MKTECSHLDIETCEKNDCQYFRAPVDCYFRFLNTHRGATYSLRAGLEKLSQKLGNCPWDGSGKYKNVCPIHQDLRQPLCSCNVWETGCVCGAFAQEQQ